MSELSISDVKWTRVDVSKRTYTRPSFIAPGFHWEKMYLEAYRLFQDAVVLEIGLLHDLFSTAFTPVTEIRPTVTFDGDRRT